MAGSFVLVVLLPMLVTGNVQQETGARHWLEHYETRAAPLHRALASAVWSYQTMMTPQTLRSLNQAKSAVQSFAAGAAQESSRFNWETFEDKNLTRMFRIISDIGIAALSEDKQKMVHHIQSDFEEIFKNKKVCCWNGARSSGLSELKMSSTFEEPEIWDFYLWAWLGWRNVTSANRKPFQTFSALLNEAASKNGYRDAGDAWRRRYGNTDMLATSDLLFKQIKPLYQHLHAYVRRHLLETYKNKKDYFEETGHIPAHVLGSMWAQSWQGLEKFLRPFPDNHLRPTNINRAMKYKGYNAAKMYLLVEDFFTSVGLGPMPLKILENSMFKKLDDRDMQCYPLAWDMKTGDDFRIRLCTRVSLNFFVKMHSLMGQIVYFMQYKNLPLRYRDGANPAFLDAAGQSFSVSARSFEYLQHLGLISSPESKEADINLLMFHALEELALFPYGVIHDKWLWSVFSGETKEDRYNRKWWELSNSLRIVLQYQFHKAMCRAAGNEVPLHRCNIFGSKRAGDKMAAMMRLGYSRPWEDAMEVLTGKRAMDAGPLLEYYQPLYDWLKEQNKGQPVGWDETCSDYAVPSDGAQPLFTLGVAIMLSPVWFQLF